MDLDDDIETTELLLLELFRGRAFAGSSVPLIGSCSSGFPDGGGGSDGAAGSSPLVLLLLRSFRSSSFVCSSGPVCAEVVVAVRSDAAGLLSVG